MGVALNLAPGVIEALVDLSLVIRVAGVQPGFERRKRRGQDEDGHGVFHLFHHIHCALAVHVQQHIIPLFKLFFHHFAGCAVVMVMDGGVFQQFARVPQLVKLFF